MASSINPSPSSAEVGLPYVVRRAEEVLALQSRWRLTVWHDEEPRPGSFWRLFGGKRSDPWQCWYGGLPENGGAKGVMLPTAEDVRIMFNTRSEEMNTSTVPAALRTLVASGRISKGEAIKAVMKDEVPPGMEKPWALWKKNKQGTQLAWENPGTGAPRLAGNLSDLIEQFTSPDGRADAMREDFLDYFGIKTGIKDPDQAATFIKSGACVEVREYCGDGWVRARFSPRATEQSTAAAAAAAAAEGGDESSSSSSSSSSGNADDADDESFWMPLGFDESNNADFGGGGADGGLDGRAWCQVLHVTAETKLWTVKEILAASSRPRPAQSYGISQEDEDDVMARMNLMFAGRLLVACKPGGLEGLAKEKKAIAAAADADPATTGDARDDDKDREDGSDEEEEEEKEEKEEKGEEKEDSDEEKEEGDDEEEGAAGETNDAEEKKEEKPGKSSGPVDWLAVTQKISKQVEAAETSTTLKNTLLLEVESRAGEYTPVGPPRGVCYVCGKRTASPTALKWHLHKCLKRWSMDQELLPHKVLRADKPPAQPRLPMPTAAGPLLEAWNRQAALIHLLDVTPRCKGCGKAFATQEKVRQWATY